MPRFNHGLKAVRQRRDDCAFDEWSGEVSKRFTDTDKWKRPWFRALDPKAKLIWFYVLDNCDHAGIWPADFGLLCYQTGLKLDRQQFEEWFSGKVIPFDGDKYFIPSFFEFQYGASKEGFKAKQSALQSLQKFGLINEDGTLREELPNSSVTVQGHSYECTGIGKGNSKGIGKEKGGLGEKTKATHPLFEIWNANRGTLPEARDLTPDRKRHAESRWAEKPSTEYWTEVVMRMARSPFCRGERNNPESQHRNWKADFDFFLKPGTHAKVLEGKYDGGSSQPRRADLEEMDRELKAQGIDVA